tara:strand:- start:26949 stop:27338 length:390 start_codon:yes stop_codon:yes gene_type:complete
MKTNREPEIAIGIIAITFVLGFLIFTHCIEKESKETEILNLPNESVLVDEQPTKYKRFDVRVKLTKHQLEKMLRSIEEEHGYFNKKNGLYIHALPQDYMLFKSVARGASNEYEISSTQLSRYTRGERIE